MIIHSLLDSAIKGIHRLSLHGRPGNYVIEQLETMSQKH